MNIVTRKSDLFDLFEIHGRIDGITSSEIKKTFDQAASDGVRTLVADFGNVSYMSSAGLRVILHTHKSFQVIGGQLILVSVPLAISEVFRISGMDKFLVIHADLASFRSLIKPQDASRSIKSVEVDGIRFERLHREANSGKLAVIGSAEKLDSSGYHRYDVVRIPQSGMHYGAGLAALGNDYGDFFNLFGESVSIGRNFFSYPATQNPSVDYSIYSDDSGNSLNFLHGFMFTGEFSEILHFDIHPETPTLEHLLTSAAQFASSDLFAVVILAVSGGILGMHLRKSPVIENKPADAGIFGIGSFAEWMSYPLEEEELHKTIVATGIVMKTDGTAGSARLLPEEGSMHVHAAVFENGLWSVDLLAFEAELQRVVRNFEVEKVVHLLPASRLKSGFIGIINLETT